MQKTGIKILPRKKDQINNSVSRILLKNFNRGKKELSSSVSGAVSV